MRIQLIIFACLIGLVGICAMPVGASVVDVPQGSTIFVGEEGLVLQPGGVLAANDTQVAWYPSGGTTVTATSVPEITVTVIPSSFDVTPVQFSGRSGGWYSYPNGGVAEATPHLAFLVDQPEAQVKLWVYTREGGKDGTDYKTIRGVKLGFRMETNLYPIFNRPGVSAGEPGIDIYVVAPGGSTYSALYDDATPPHASPPLPISTRRPPLPMCRLNPVPAVSGTPAIPSTGGQVCIPTTPMPM